MSSSRRWICCLLCLGLGASLRFAGLTRGTSDFVLPEAAPPGTAAAFYHFHPDEDMIVGAALRPIDPLDPAFTVYGSLPVYLLRGALQWILPDHGETPPPLADPAFTRPVFITARLLAALFSCLTLGLTWEIGRRYFGATAACLATAFVAVAPGAIQQAHFYIVDGLFGLLSLAAVYAILRAQEEERRWWHLAAGLLIGAAAAVKLTGLQLGVVMVGVPLARAAAHRTASWPARLSAPFRGPNLWLAGGVALLTLVALEPYLVLEPQRLLQGKEIGDFAASAAIASGDVLRPWTLADVHTLPYLHHWTHLLPLVAGWPLTVLFLAGLAHALYRRSTPGLVLLAWFTLHFALIGGLHAKHVRYLVPLLPVLALLGGDLLARLIALRPPALPRRGARAVGLGLAAVTLGYTGLYGLAFARIYTVEDSRLQAARWLQDHVPAGRAVGVEAGGYSLAPLVSRESFSVRPLGEARTFATRGYLTCRGTWEFMRRQLLGADYLALVDANRYLQFTAAPDLMPAMADLYGRLVDGRLGFDVVQRLQVPVTVAGLPFAPDRAETSFLGYDHPTVFILQRRADFEARWDRWRLELERHPRCPDGALAAIAAAVRAGDLNQASWRVEGALERYPDVPLTSLLAAYVHLRRGETGLDVEDRERFSRGTEDASLTANLIPWASSMSLIGLGLHELVPTVLQAGRRPAGPDDRETLGHTYREVGDALAECGQGDLAAYAYRAAAEIRPDVRTWVALGRVLHQSGDLAASNQAYTAALKMDPAHLAARLNLGWNCYLQGDYARAIELNRQVLADQESLGALCNLGLARLAAGDRAAGERCYADAVARFGVAEIEKAGAVQDLRELAARDLAAGNLAARDLTARDLTTRPDAPDGARSILDRYWPRAPSDAPLPAAAPPR